MPGCVNVQPNKAGNGSVNLLGIFEFLQVLHPLLAETHIHGRKGSIAAGKELWMIGRGLFSIVACSLYGFSRFSVCPVKCVNIRFAVEEAHVQICSVQMPPDVGW